MQKWHKFTDNVTWTLMLNREMLTYLISHIIRPFRRQSSGTHGTQRRHTHACTHARRAGWYLSDNRCNAIHINLLATLDQVSILGGRQVFEWRGAQRTRLPFDVCRCAVRAVPTSHSDFTKRPDLYLLLCILLFRCLLNSYGCCFYAISDFCDIYAVKDLFLMFYKLS